MPFETPEDREDHFEDHRAEFAIINAIEYEARADAFMFGELGVNVLECFRVQGGWARYDQVTQEYGTVDTSGFLSTYFIPNPLIHGYASNLEYFHARC